MYVTVSHAISDADRFWAAAERELPNLAPNLKLHLCTPITDGKTAFCLWEVDSVEALRNWMEPLLGEVSRNDYHVVDAEKAIGLPGGAKLSQTTASGTKR